MGVPEVLDIAQDAIFTLLLVASPIMGVGLVVGLTIALVQALTSIQEMTLVFVPKIFAIFLALLVFLPYASLITAYGFYYSFLHSKKDRIRILIVLFVVISLVGVTARDFNYYNWRLKEELPLVDDYYKFFIDKEIKGPILTTDPVPAVYIDAKFIPFYFSIDQGYRIYNLNKNNAFATIFSPESFYCADEECKTKLINLSQTIEKNNKLIFSEIYQERAYYIYLNTITSS